MANYYSDSVNGNDGNSGLSELLPKLTLSQVAALTGDHTGNAINLARGSEWREMLTMASSYGTVGNPFVVQDYGSGALPIINGADIVTATWVQDGTGWYIPLSGIQALHYNSNVQIINVATSAELIADTSWFDSGNSRLYVQLPGDANPNNTVIEITTREYCINMTSNNNIDLKYIHTRYGWGSNIRSNGSTANIWVRYCETYYAGGWDLNNGRDGIVLYGTNPTLATGTIVAYNISKYNQNNGLEFDSHDGLIAEGNILEYNSGGIELWGYITNSRCSTNKIMHCNKIGTSNNPGRSYWITPDSTRGNHSSNVFNGNLCVGATSSQVVVASGTGHILQNNIFYHSDVSIARYPIDLQTKTTVTGTDIAFDSATNTISSTTSDLTIPSSDGTIIVTGSASNAGTYTVSGTPTSTAIVTNEALVDEAAGATVKVANSLPGLILRNNIICTVRASSDNWLLNSPAGTVAVLDYNLYWSFNDPLSGNFTKIVQPDKGSTQNTFAQLQGVGDEANGLNADPLFADADNDNFTMPESSPVAGAGIKYWGTGVRPLSLNGTLFDTRNPDIGCYQIKGDFYPG